MNPFEELKGKLKSDRLLRSKFNSDIRELLIRHGIDPMDPSLHNMFDTDASTANANCYGVSPQIIVCDDN